MEQWYANNTTIKFPLDPFHEEDLPDDLLVDMAVSVPEGMDVYLTNLVATDKYVFLSLEATDGSAVGHCVQAYPSVSAIIPLIMSTDGYGWVVFGPGIREVPREYKDVRIKLDASVLLPDIPIANPFDLFVDGKAYERPEILNIKTLDYATVEETEDELRLVRADSKLSGNMNITLFTSQEFGGPAVTTLNGVAGNDSGNIDLLLNPDPLSDSITEIKRTTDDTIIGLLMKAYHITDCGDETERLKEKLLCRTEYGITVPLPLDFVNCTGDECPPFSVYYNGNYETGGTAPTDDVTYNTGDLVTVLGNVGGLVRSGYSWSGWNTQPDGTGTDYSSASTFNITANMVLYAKWI